MHYSGYVIFSLLLALLVLVIVHKQSPLALKLYCSYYLIGDMLNPLIFIKNQEMYKNSPWGETGNFSFKYENLFESYQHSYLIIFMIVIFSYILTSIDTRNYSLKFNNLKSTFDVKKIDVKYFYIYLIISSIIYIYAYQIKLGITGVDGNFKYHLSGILHYYRSYIAPLFICYFLTGLKGFKYKLLAFLFFYSIISGITSSSRFVGIIPIILLIPYLIKNQKIVSGIILGVLIFINWVIITISRDLTFSGNELNFFETLYYSISNFFNLNFYYVLDGLTGRLSGAQQTILAFQHRGMESCQNINLFFLGNPVCANVAKDLYQLNLSGTSYGIGLSVITSILIHSHSWYSYIIPSFIIALFIWFANLTYLRIIDNKILSRYSFYFIFLSVIFLFSGPLLFFYILEFIAWTLIYFISKYYDFKR